MKNELITTDDLDVLSQRGRAIYDEKLKALLEPEHNGQDVAIHLDSGDYQVGPRSARPAVALRRRHQDGGAIMTTLIGPPQSDDTLAYTMLLSRRNLIPQSP